VTSCPLWLLVLNPRSKLRALLLFCPQADS
jgi:hypothetical protein